MVQFKEELLTDYIISVHCNTEAKAKKLLEWADSKGQTWCAGVSYINNSQWDKYKSNTCYSIYLGMFGDRRDILPFENIISYENAILDKTKVIYNMIKEKLYV
ncbi:MAG: hypothetical protein PF569_02375 [Candidatus Woesearchaeota archaeon]|nr:hypothetical protein [Candidatus Woesearchaeota archaeon]